LKKQLLFTVLFTLFLVNQLVAQETIAKLWTHHLLFAVKNDFARPTMHARNLFHSSVVMYDAWAAYEGDVDFYLLGHTHAGLYSPFEGVVIPEDILAAQNEAICFAMYRLMTHRFINSPGAGNTLPRINAFMDSLNYDRTNISTDYSNGGPAELGNYIAAKMIQVGYLDGSNEIGNFANLYYSPVQGPVEPEFPGNPNMTDPNRWQPIALSYAVDQAGNVLTSNPPFLSPEWGDVLPFAIPSNVQTTHTRNGDDYIVHHDPGVPVFLDTALQSQLDSYYKWNFTLVSVWQSHLDPADTTVWDISPASVGNIQNYPTQYSDYANFYNYFDGGDAGIGYALNPKTNLPYVPQLVKRADYARVLAEFWADGLDSETPPGHWVNIYNEISAHPLYEKKWKGVGPVLDDLQYDVKMYLTLGGAMHDAAISAWSIKGWYDYPRPVSAIRYMAEKGQSTDNMQANYHPAGLPLVPGYIEVVQLGDSLVGAMNEHLGKIKLYTWRGPDYIANPLNTYAGVGWILAENWWPYQRPSFVTPPFAGYVSGHSTFSRAAAEVLTYITGDPFFPGGMSEFVAHQDEFLEFEDGPSTDVLLEWATYRDASDQCSLSRIWGGIHPPTDDLNGRMIGEIIGLDAAGKADSIFQILLPKVDSVVSAIPYVNIERIGQSFTVKVYFSEAMNTGVPPQLAFLGMDDPLANSLSINSSSWLTNQLVEIDFQILAVQETLDNILAQIGGGENLSGKIQNPFIEINPFIIDKQKPFVTNFVPSASFINDSIVEFGEFYIDVIYNESCDINVTPVLTFSNPSVLLNVLNPNPGQSSWLDAFTYRASFDLIDNNLEILNIGLLVDSAQDLASNPQFNFSITNLFDVNTVNPMLVNYSFSDTILSIADLGSNALICNFEFNQALQSNTPSNLILSMSNLIGTNLQLNPANTMWLDSFNVQLSYNLTLPSFESGLLDADLSNFKDGNGNPIGNAIIPDAFEIDTKKPDLVAATPSALIVSDNELGTTGFSISLVYSEAMNPQQKPIVELFLSGVLNTEINYNVFGSDWLNDSIFEANFNVVDNDVEIDNFELRVNFAKDDADNPQDLAIELNWINLDTKNPSIVSFTASAYLVTSATNQLKFTAIFDEPMDPNGALALEFINAAGIENVLVPNPSASQWLNNLSYELVYDVQALSFAQEYMSIRPIDATDLALNKLEESAIDSFLTIQVDPTGIRDLHANLDVYPNPVKAGGPLFIQFVNKLNVNSVVLVNEIGMTCMDYSLDQFNKDLVALKIPENLNGLYWLRMETKDNVIIAKIVVVP
jgi:hypothetical protein